MTFLDGTSIRPHQKAAGAARKGALKLSETHVRRLGALVSGMAPRLDGTKACVIADGRGRAVAFTLASGQAHELPHAIPLLGHLPGVPTWVVADRGYASHAFRDPIWERGARPAIPSKRNEAPVACPDWIYNNATKSSGSGPGSRSGEPSLPATRRPPQASWASSPSQPHAIGSSHNRP